MTMSISIKTAQQLIVIGSIILTAVAIGIISWIVVGGEEEAHGQLDNETIPLSPEPDPDLPEPIIDPPLYSYNPSPQKNENKGNLKVIVAVPKELIPNSIVCLQYPIDTELTGKNLTLVKPKGNKITFSNQPIPNGEQFQVCANAIYDVDDNRCVTGVNGPKKTPERISIPTIMKVKPEPEPEPSKDE